MPMTRPPCRYLALALLAFLVSAVAPPAIAAAAIRAPTVAATAPAIAPGATQGSARVDTAVRAVAVDSTAMRRAIDSATKRAVDSATKRAIDSTLTQLSEDRRQWGRVINGLLVLGGVFLLLLVWDMLRGHDVMVESHWGGFGGGAGGTRLSRALVLTVLLLLTGGMLTVLAVARPGRVRVVESGAKADTSRVAR